MFVYCFVDASAWGFSSRLFPQTVAIVGFFLAGGALFFDWRGMMAMRAGTADEDVVGIDRPYV